MENAAAAFPSKKKTRTQLYAASLLEAGERPGTSGSVASKRMKIKSGDGFQATETHRYGSFRPPRDGSYDNEGGPELVSRHRHQQR